MTGELLVAQIAKELLQGNATIVAFGQIALETDSETELQLPATIVSAQLEDDEIGRDLATRYSLTVEQRTLPGQPDPDDADTAFAAIDAALDPASPPTRPTSLTAGSYFRIEKETGSDITIGETTSRKRLYTVFAQFA